MRCPSSISDALTYSIFDGWLSVYVCVCGVYTFPVITVFGGPSILMSCNALSLGLECYFDLFIDIKIQRPHSDAH